jgi:putative NIF3 family GTP cyclohydrolase 1 type 2
MATTNVTSSTKPCKLSDVVSALQAISPLHLASSWDNVGLLVEPSGNKFPHYIMYLMLVCNREYHY